MTSTASLQYYPSLTAATAREHVADLHRAAEASRVRAALRRRRHRTARRRPTWWLSVVPASPHHTAHRPRRAALDCADSLSSRETSSGPRPVRYRTALVGCPADSPDSGHDA
jgi:hypothetical protein